MYAVTKSGRWLMGHMPLGVQEFVDGHLKDIETCIWCVDIRNAEFYGTREEAQAAATAVNGDVMDVSDTVTRL